MQTVLSSKLRLLSKRNAATACRAGKNEVPKPKDALAVAAFAACLAVTPMVQPPVADANAYQDRLAALEKRRAMLQELKESAEAEGTTASSDAPVAPSYLESMKKSLSIAVPEVNFEEPAPAEPAPEAPRGFSFGKPAAPAPDTAPSVSKAPAATPSPEQPSVKPWWERLDEIDEIVPATPKKEQTPAPAAKVEPPVKVEAKKQEPAKQQAPASKKEEPGNAEAKKADVKKQEEASKKRKGPLPLFLAQVLMFGAFYGIGWTVLYKGEALGKVQKSINAALTKATTPAP